MELKVGQYLMICFRDSPETWDDDGEPLTFKDEAYLYRVVGVFNQGTEIQFETLTIDERTGHPFRSSIMPLNFLRSQGDLAFLHSNATTDQIEALKKLMESKS